MTSVPLSEYESALERAAGKTIGYMRDTPIDEQRLEAERIKGKPTTLISRFPLIGRGSVLRDRTISHEEVEKAFEDAMR